MTTYLVYCHYGFDLVPTFVVRADNESHAQKVAHAVWYDYYKSSVDKPVRIEEIKVYE